MAGKKELLAITAPKGKLPLVKKLSGGEVMFLAAELAIYWRVDEEGYLIALEGKVLSNAREV